MLTWLLLLANTALEAPDSVNTTAQLLKQNSVMRVLQIHT